MVEAAQRAPQPAAQRAEPAEAAVRPHQAAAQATAQATAQAAAQAAAQATAEAATQPAAQEAAAAQPAATVRGPLPAAEVETGAEQAGALPEQSLELMC